MNKSDSIKELATALAKAQAEIENASKNSQNPHFRSKYADLAEVLNTVRPVFSKHGISLIQAPSYESGIASVETMLAHASGEWMSGTCSAPVSKQDAQGVGSAITYLRRYSLAAFAGIAQEDDDANSAVGHQHPARNSTSRPVQVETSVGKPVISAEIFAQALQAVGSGTRTAAAIESKYSLTTEQSSQLAEAERLRDAA